jgi:hypothetical protein
MIGEDETRSVLGLVLMFVCATVAGPAMAKTPADYEAVRNHVTCYPFGIDKSPRRMWRSCGWTRRNQRNSIGVMSRWPTSRIALVTGVPWREQLDQLG